MTATLEGQISGRRKPTIQGVLAVIPGVYTGNDTSGSLQGIDCREVSEVESEVQERSQAGRT